jgi:hypothetical protein
LHLPPDLAVAVADFFDALAWQQGDLGNRQSGTGGAFHQLFWGNGKVRKCRTASDAMSLIKHESNHGAMLWTREQ